MFCLDRGLGSIPQGLKDLEERKTWGKVAVQIRDPSTGEMVVRDAKTSTGREAKL